MEPFGLIGGRPRHPVSGCHGFAQCGFMPVLLRVPAGKGGVRRINGTPGERRGVKAVAKNSVIAIPRSRSLL